MKIVTLPRETPGFERIIDDLEAVCEAVAAWEGGSVIRFELPEAVAFLIEGNYCNDDVVVVDRRRR